MAFVPAFNITVVDDNLEDLSKWVDEAIEVAIEVLKEQWQKIPGEDSSFIASWKLSLRLPRSLHKKLYYSAKIEWVSINQLILSKVAI
jgi:predicted HicB family RNase H-like nuclease